MTEDKDMLMEFNALTEDMKRLFRISVLKQNKIIEKFINRLRSLDDGLMGNDAVVDVLQKAMPLKLRFHEKKGLDDREKAVCGKFFADQMDMLHYQVANGWDGRGDYPYDNYQAIIAASERMLHAIESMGMNDYQNMVSYSEAGDSFDDWDWLDDMQWSQTAGHCMSIHAVAEGCESMIYHQVSPLGRDICNFSDYEPCLVKGVLLMQKNLFFCTLKSSWNQTRLLHGWGLDESEKSVPAATKNMTAKSAPVPDFLSPDHSNDVAAVDQQQPKMPAAGAQDSTTPDALSLQLCAVDDLKKTLSNAKKMKSADPKPLEKLRDNKGCVSLAAIPASYRNILSRFRARFPHMNQLADEIEANLSLLSMGGSDMPLNLLPQICILDGVPGVGKTVAVSFLAKEFEIAFRIIDCAGLSNGFDIVGQSSGWSSGKPGHVAEMLIGRQSPNGIIILDEVDKMNGSDSSPVSNALYSLLEPESARRFRDEFYDFEMDASHINWLATSNFYEQIPAPIRDRAKRITIPAPNMEQRKTIASYLYQDYRLKHEHIWGKYFAPDLPDHVAAFIAAEKGMSIRGMKQIIQGCFSTLSMQESGASQKQPQSITISEEIAAKSAQAYMKQNTHQENRDFDYAHTRVGFIQPAAERGLRG